MGRGSEYGADRTSRLVQALLSQSRTEDISRAVIDKGYSIDLGNKVTLYKG